jgi:hypothetical protein
MAFLQRDRGEPEIIGSVPDRFRVSIYVTGGELWAPDGATIGHVREVGGDGLPRETSYNFWRLRMPASSRRAERAPATGGRTQKALPSRRDELGRDAPWVD